MRRWRSGAGTIVAVAVLLAAACGSETNVPAGTSPTSTVGSEPAPATAPPSTGAPTRQDFLSVGDVRPLIAFGFDLRELPVLDPGRFDLTTLRGPCGTLLPTPFRPDGDVKVFFSTVALIVEASASGDDAGRQLIDAARTDLRAGCAPFSDPAVFGGMVALKGPIELPVVGEDRIGWTQTIAGGDRTGLRQVALVRTADRVVMLVATTAPATVDDQFLALARAAFVP